MLLGNDTMEFGGKSGRKVIKVRGPGFASHSHQSDLKNEASFMSKLPQL